MREQTKILSALAKRLAIVERKLSVPSSFDPVPTRVAVDSATVISSSSPVDIGTTTTELTVTVPRPNMKLVFAIMADVGVTNTTNLTTCVTQLYNGTSYYSNQVVHRFPTGLATGTRFLGTQILVPTIATPGDYTFTLRGSRTGGTATCTWNATHSGIALLNSYG